MTCGTWRRSWTRGSWRTASSRPPPGSRPPSTWDSISSRSTTVQSSPGRLRTGSSTEATTIPKWTGRLPPSGGRMRFLLKGKVKEVYEVSEDELEFVFTDQISVFDKVIPTLVPHKGETLCRTSAHWFKVVADLGIRTHFLGLPAGNRKRGLIHVDGKKEFAMDEDRRLMLVDTFGTADEDRFWDAEAYGRGEHVELSKEYVRQYYREIGYHKALMEARAAGRPEPDIPPLPADVTKRVSDLYVGLFERLTGERFRP